MVGNATNACTKHPHHDSVTIETAVTHSEESERYEPSDHVLRELFPDLSTGVGDVTSTSWIRPEKPYLTGVHAESIRLDPMSHQSTPLQLNHST